MHVWQPHHPRAHQGQHLHDGLHATAPSPSPRKQRSGDVLVVARHGHRWRALQAHWTTGGGLLLPRGRRQVLNAAVIRSRSYSSVRSPLFLCAKVAWILYKTTVESPMAPQNGAVCTRHHCALTRGSLFELPTRVFKNARTIRPFSGRRQPLQPAKGALRAAVPAFLRKPPRALPYPLPRALFAHFADSGV